MEMEVAASAMAPVGRSRQIMKRIVAVVAGLGWKPIFEPKCMNLATL